jgi:hypothetical protein
MKTLSDALISLYSGVDWILTGDEYIGLDWKSKEIPKPSEEELQAEIIRLQAEYDSLEYQRLRKPEYPTMQEQLDMQYWDAINGTTTWQDAINAVKAKYPKPTES